MRYRTSHLSQKADSRKLVALGPIHLRTKSSTDVAPQQKSVAECQGAPALTSGKHGPCDDRIVAQIDPYLTSIALAACVNNGLVLMIKSARATHLDGLRHGRSETQ
jgi:hypothetical protein